MTAFERAKKYLVGGVNSPVRAFNYVGGDPLVIEKGKGSRVYDHEGNSYIDYVLSYGAAILGHAHPDVVKSVQSAAEKGLGFGATGSGEIELAKLIHEAAPHLEKIRFVSSGTEAVMGATRLARGYTGREKIVKFENAYHGHADHLLVKGGSGLATMQIPLSRGVPGDFIKHTLIAEYGNKDFIEGIFALQGKDIAAVIVEPIGGNHGVVPPDEDFLRYLRELTEKHGALLIFDEVITGFRFAFGMVAQEFGIRPDITCLGKIIGGGLPIGAYGGREEIMEHLAPLGEVYQASTFAGNPVVMRAGIAALKALASQQARHGQLAEMTADIALFAGEEARKLGIGLEVSFYGTMFSFKFPEKNAFRVFYRELLDKGVYLAPSEYEANFVSFAHTPGDIEDTKRAIGLALKKVRQEEGK